MVWFLKLRSEDEHDTVLEEVVKLYRVRIQALGIEVVDPGQKVSTGK